MMNQSQHQPAVHHNMEMITSTRKWNRLMDWIAEPFGYMTDAITNSTELMVARIAPDSFWSHKVYMKYNKSLIAYKSSALL